MPEKREKDLKASGDLIYRWQYKVRWAATELRKSGKWSAQTYHP
jgi:hypothetical protein